MMIFMKLFVLQVSAVLVESLRVGMTGQTAPLEALQGRSSVVPEGQQGDQSRGVQMTSFDGSDSEQHTQHDPSEFVAGAPAAVAESSSDASVVTATQPSTSSDLARKAQAYYKAAAVTLLEEAVKILLDRVIYYHRMKKVKTELDAEIAKVQGRVDHLETMKREATEKVATCTAKWQTLING